MLLRFFVIEAAGIEHAVKIDLRHRGLDHVGLRIERADDLARGINGLGRGRIDLVQNDHIGEFDLIDKQIDKRAIIAVAERLAAILEKIGRGIILRRLAASTTVTIVSSRVRSARLRPPSSRNSNVAATGKGSAMPVDSIRR